MKISGFILFLVSLSVTGCSSLIFPSSSPPVYYQLDHKTTTTPCPVKFGESVRIWRFGAAGPYDHRDMVVIRDGREISVSRAFQWIAAPGAMISDILYRDLSTGGLFPQVVTANDPAQVPLDMTGRIEVFAWEREGDVSRAVLEMEVSMTENGSASGELFHKSYSLKSEPESGEGSSADFVRAMGSLVDEISVRIRRDLCGFAEKQRKPAGNKLP